MTTRVTMTDEFGRGRPGNAKGKSRIGEMRGSRPTMTERSQVSFPEDDPPEADSWERFKEEYGAPNPSFWDKLRIALSKFIMPKGTLVLGRLDAIDWDKFQADCIKHWHLAYPARKEQVMVLQLDEVEIIEDE